MTDRLAIDAPELEHEVLEPGVVLLRRWACGDDILGAIAEILAAAPPRRMVTPGGGSMSVAMTACGALGWIADRRGYRYAQTNPATGRPWPAMPEPFRRIAGAAAREAGFDAFAPDTCLVNLYEPGSRLGLHQDQDEHDLSHPIVSISLGLPAVFLLGLARTGHKRRIGLAHGDVLVFGGPARLAFHGVAPLAPGTHPLLGSRRINLTFRRAG